MKDETRSNIDPRFDPAFQRGFDPVTPIREHASVPPATAATAAAPTAKATSAEPAVLPEPAVLSDRSPLSPDTTSAILNAEDATELSPGSHPSRNPYLLLLAAVSVILVAIGVWLFAQSGAQFNSREVRSQGDYVSLDATIHMAPFISLLGAATAIGVVFVFAVKWRHRE
jgi:hypothetical protein